MEQDTHNNGLNPHKKESTAAICRCMYITLYNIKCYKILHKFNLFLITLHFIVTHKMLS